MINSIINLIALSLFILYAFQVIKFYIGLNRLAPGLNNHCYSVSIIVPARNESTNISRCLDSLIQQNYPAEKMEIIVVNDRSDDNTELVVEQYCSKHPFIKLLNIEKDQISSAPKKFAIEKGIESSIHEIIITTDADSMASQNWVNAIISHFQHNVGVVAGPVMFHKNDETNFYSRIQSLEFLSLIIAGMGSIGMNEPIIANGANLAYRKTVFNQVDGFSGIDDLKTGDDDLFIQKVNESTSHKIVYATTSDSVIYTKPARSCYEFIKQRTRWASKGSRYESNSLKLYLIAVYFLYLYMLLVIPFILLGLIKATFPLIIFFMKLILDAILMKKGLNLLNRSDLLKYIFPTELFQLIYVVLVGFLGFFDLYQWKGN